MSAAMPQPRSETVQTVHWKSFLSDWWPAAAGLLAMFVPTFIGLANGMWSTESYAHGPIILALAVWLLWRQWPDMLAAIREPRPSAAGWPLLILALLCYVIGRSQGIQAGELLAFVLLLVALLLLGWGGRALRFQWFPIFFMLFMIPLPGPLVAALTMPMKMAVSYMTELILFAAGYPIARSGVILQIGQYQLLVADACAGLQTLLTLEALGLFYLNVVRHTAALRNVMLALLIIPISFTANVIRVIALTLITYYFGDAAGQGFLHGFAGMVLFITALVLILFTDTLLQRIVMRRERKAARSKA
jgi:exosortase B